MAAVVVAVRVGAGAGERVAAPGGRDDAWDAGHGGLWAFDARRAGNGWPNSNDRLALRCGDIADGDANCDIDQHNYANAERHTNTKHHTHADCVANGNGNTHADPDADPCADHHTRRGLRCHSRHRATGLHTGTFTGSGILHVRLLWRPVHLRELRQPIRGAILFFALQTGDRGGLDLDGDQSACAWNATPVMEQSAP